MFKFKLLDFDWFCETADYKVKRVGERQECFVDVAKIT